MTAWQKYVPVTASRTEHGVAELHISMGLTGLQLVLAIGDERIVIASRWHSYTSDHGCKQLIDAINEGLQALKDHPYK